MSEKTSCRHALILMVIVIMVCIAIYQGSPSQAAGQQLATPQATVTEASGQPITLLEIHMMNDKEGWGTKQTKDFFVLLFHTSDGGNTWQNVTPPLPFDEYGCGTPLTYFHDSLHAILLYTIHVWLTSDGGLTWTPSSIPALNGYPSGFVSFVDIDHGWLLTTDCCAAGNEEAWLYQTNDGGQNWELINDDESFGQIQKLTSAYHTGLAFATKQEGWMTAASIVGFGAVYHTTDGGRNWDALDLPIPQGEKSLNGCDMAWPTVFSPQSFSFAATCYMGDYDHKHAVFLYHTQDNGATWSVNRVSVANAGIPLVLGGTVMRIISPKASWIWVGRDPEPIKIFETLDGGKTWTELIQFSSVNILDIADENTIWANDKTGELIYTSDAGKTWKVLYPRADFTTRPDYPDCQLG